MPRRRSSNSASRRGGPSVPQAPHADAAFPAAVRERCAATCRTGAGGPPPGCGAEPRRGVPGFTDPATRLLIGSSGYTTVLLERRLECPLGVRVVRQALLPASQVCEGVLRLLPVEGQARALVRDSELVTPSGTPVSRNTVIATTAAASPLGRALADTSTPLGRSLAAHAGQYGRELVASGRRPWLWEAPPSRAVRADAAWRGYVIRAQGHAEAYVEERFNPALVNAS